jgi:hypothetical protein
VTEPRAYASTGVLDEGSERPSGRPSPPPCYDPLRHAHTHCSSTRLPAGSLPSEHRLDRAPGLALNRGRLLQVDPAAHRLRGPPHDRRILPVDLKYSTGLCFSELLSSSTCRIRPSEIPLAIRHSARRPSRFAIPGNSRSTSGYQHHVLARHSVQHAQRSSGVPSIPPDRERGTQASACRASPNLSVPRTLSPFACLS